MGDLFDHKKRIPEKYCKEKCPLYENCKGDHDHTCPIIKRPK